MPTIANRTRGVLVCNIPCSPGCTRKDCLCTRSTMQLAEVDKEGTKGIREVEKHVPGSVTFLSLEKKEVPQFVADAPDVKRAIDRGALRLL